MQRLEGTHIRFRYFLLSLFLFLPLPAAAQVAVCKDDNPTRNCCGVTTLAGCPVEGCGGDPELNRKKNRTDLPTVAGVALTFTQLTAFKYPKKWSAGTKRTLLESWGEGRSVQLTGYIFDAENYTQGAESTNCYLTTNDFNDFHIVLVEDLVLANKWKTLDDAISQATTSAKKKAAEKKAKAAHLRAERRSLTAEITARLRLDGWTIVKLRDLARRFAYVRVTGWAMLDTQHISRPIARRSNWELHPVTKFEVCTTTVAECSVGNGWVELRIL